MHPWPDTRDTLLARLHDPADQEAWESFARMYEALIFRVARRHGLQDADARDVMQRVLLSVAETAEDWKLGNPKGRFRGWLKRAATNATLNLLQRDRRHRADANTRSWELIQNAKASDALTGIWMHEHRLELFRQAAAKVQARFSEENWQCFWRTTIEEESIENVAHSTNKSLGAIYAARSRIMACIRREVERLQASEQ